MSDQNNSKVCIGCLEAKPLSSFLQMTSANGGVIYGNMCSGCRKANLERLKNADREESTRSSTGFKIDSKAKVASDTDKKTLKQEKDELYHEERDEEQELQIKELEKNDQLAKEEKEYREENKAKQTKVAKEKSRVLTPEEERAAKAARVDMTVATIDAGQALQKFQNATFRNFKAFLGGSSPIVRHAERVQTYLAKQANADAAKDTASKALNESAQTKEAASKSTAENKNNPTQKQTLFDPGKQAAVPNKNIFGTSKKASELNKITDPIEFAIETNKPTPPGSRRR